MLSYLFWSIRNKKGIITDYLAWIIIAVIILVIVVVAYFMISGKQIEAFEFIKKILRFGN